MTDYPFNADKPVKADTIANFCIYTEQNAEHLMRSLYGFVRRSKFRWKDADEIYIGPGCYHHFGSTRNRLVWWNSELTFKLGSGGSNAASDDLGNDQWHYIYIDDTAVNTLASNELTEVQILGETTAPAWSDTNHGYYNGDDRCIFAVRTSGAAAVLEFEHDGGELVMWGNYIQATNNTNIALSDSFASSDPLTVPGFCTKALVNFRGQGGDAACTLQWREGDSSASSGHSALYVPASTSAFNSNQVIVVPGTSFDIDLKESAASTAVWQLYEDGWFLPRGM